MKLFQMFGGKRRLEEKELQRRGGGRRNSLTRSRSNQKLFSLDPSSSVVTNDESCSTVSSSKSETPWRVENILLTGAPRSSDWWEDGGYGSDGDLDPYEEESNHSYKHHKHRLQPGRGGRRFRNCGLETWHLSRELWKESAPPSSSSPVDSTLLSSLKKKTSKKRGRIKELVGPQQQQLQHKRHPLAKKSQTTQRVPLKDLVQAFSMKWAEEAGDVY